MGTRNIDIQPESTYDAQVNDAANEHVKKAGVYTNSYQALAYKQAFRVGADTATTVEFDEELLDALIAGRAWALAEQS